MDRLPTPEEIEDELAFFAEATARIDMGYEGWVQVGQRHDLYSDIRGATAVQLERFRIYEAILEKRIGELRPLTP